MRLGLILVVVVTLTSAGAVWAHKDKLPEDALTLVRQASALLAQNPSMTGEVKERLQAALGSKKPEGVHLEQVAEALRTLDSGDIVAARRLLMTAIMPAGMPMLPAGPTRAAPRPTAEPSVAAPPPAVPQAQASPPSVDAALQMAAPLRVGFTGSIAESITLSAGLALAVLGLVSLWRARGGGRR